MTREFKATKAVRSRVPLMIGLVGPSGSGKTKSALRLAEGVKMEIGDGAGPIVFIDTESRRGLHYASDHEFLHIEFPAPFDALSYLDALRHAASMNPSVIIVDSMSHEHEGPGGMLDQHEAFLDKKCGDDWKKREKLGMLAWAEPKKQRRQLINGLLQLDVPAMIFCFRAKEKIKLIPGKEPEQQGWMPIAGDEFVYEMTTCALLTPNCKGRPTWDPEEKGSQSIVKLPGQFSSMLNGQLDESMGRAMAEWAAGVDPVEAAISKLREPALHGREAMTSVWRGLSPALRDAIPKDQIPKPVEAPKKPLADELDREELDSPDGGM